MAVCQFLELRYQKAMMTGGAMALLLQCFAGPREQRSAQVVLLEG